MQSRQRYAVDSRKVIDQDVFIALSGANFDGHDFLCEAKQNGAKGAIIKKGTPVTEKDLVLCSVDDPVEELQALAREEIQMAKIVIGVTGSYAKTTTKETIADYLSEYGPCFRTQGNANSQIGLPLSICNDYKGEPIAIIEMGIEHPNDMKKLKKIVSVDYAVLTRIAPAHIETMGTIENIVLEKTDIIDKDRTKVLFAHYSVEKYLQRLDLSPVHVEYYGHVEEKLFEDLQDLVHRISEHLFLEKKPVKVAQVPLRFEELVFLKGRAYLDCYNANPASMQEFFVRFAGNMECRRKVAVLGAMASLSDSSSFYHQQIAEEVALHYELVFLHGEHFAKSHEYLINNGYNSFFSIDIEKLQQLLDHHLKEEDVVFVKGSNVNRLWEIKECLKTIFS